MKSRLFRLPAIVATVVVLGVGSLSAQVSFKIDITATCGVLSKVATLGVNPGNTIGIDTDPALGEYQESVAPPLGPTVLLDARFPVGAGTAIFKDIRGYASPDQADIYYLTVQGDYVLTKVLTLSWPSTIGQFASSWTIKTVGSPQLIPTNMVGLTGVTIAPDGLTRSVTFQIVKVGAFPPQTPGPTFVLSQGSLYFGAVGVGLSASQSVKVSNTGALNPLIISGVTLPPDYSISPGTFPLTVNQGDAKTFSVTFSPSATGTRAGNIVFAHNAAGGTSALLVTGNGLQQLGTLMFSTLHRSLLDNTANCADTIGLHVSGFPLHAVQFTMLTDGQIIFRGVDHGLDHSKFQLSYDVFRGANANGFGATDDSIRVVLYGINSNSLAALDYPSAILLKYDVVNIASAVETSHIRLVNILGSLFDSSDGNVNSAGDETLTVTNRTSKGDVNLDDRIDVLDLLLVVDYITGRTTLSGAQFTAADMFPYPAGNGAVNVQDLSLLQKTILTNMYPDSTRIMKAPVAVRAATTEGAPAQATGTDARVVVHATASGIAVWLSNAVPVKGLQLSLRNVRSVPGDLSIRAAFGEASYHYDGELLRLLVYSPVGESLPPGDHIVALLPFALPNPDDIAPGDLTVAGTDNRALAGVGTAVAHEEVQGAPSSYALQQNYPNPFNPTTEIRFSVPSPSEVKLVVYNTLGQEVRTLFAGHAEPGTRVVRWDGRDDRGGALSSGMYVYRITAGDFVQSRKMLLLK
ncbi:MAG TPA: choice-of-anchor D domain-containing protein [Bacteroidota bacterium]|nr:choice-of-anchor D domain-containing protein [Bacteroidota bacterium]